MTAADPVPALLACEDIHIRLGGRPILEGISVSIRAGEILGVVGPNGAGKTTLFEVLSGRYVPDRGRVVLGGQDITSLKLFARARLGLGRTYQSPVVPDALTVAEVFRAARQAYRPFLTRFHAEWAAEKVGLRVPMSALAGSLETLNRRKLLLACLLMRRPRVMLLDEPAAGLINAEIDELDGIIRHFAREMNIGVMLVEHRLELLSAIADRVVVLDLGKLIAEGDPAAGVRRSPRARRLFRGRGGMSDVLQIEDLSAGYGPLGVLHSVNLTVRAGERIGIVGLNGHGKSTLLRAIAGLTGWQSGSIKLNGVEIGGTRTQGPGRYTHKIVRMGLALMPQGDALFHGLSVADHLDSGAYTKRAWRERKQRRERVLRSSCRCASCWTSRWASSPAASGAWSAWRAG